MRVYEINEMAIFDTSDFDQDERSFQPLIYLEYVFKKKKKMRTFYFKITLV